MKDILKHIFEKVDLMMFICAATVMAIFVLVVWALIYRAIPVENKEILIHVLGIIEGAVMTIVSFYYGSSKGSQKKDEDRRQAISITPGEGSTMTTKTEVNTEETPKQ